MNIVSQEFVKNVQAVEIEARKKVEQINNMPVANRVDCDKMTEWLKTLVVFIKQVTKTKKEQQEPYKSQIDIINKAYKPAEEFLHLAETTARDKINAYLVEERKIKEAEARKIEEQRRKEAEKELKKLDRQDAKADKYDDATAQAIHDSIADKKAEILAKATESVEINQANDTSSVRMIWDFNVVDLSKVPVEYLTINTTAVREAIRNGSREIAGLEIFQKPVVAIK